MIIAISGKAGSGKDTFADVLVQKHNFIKISLADILKRFCEDFFRWPNDILWGSSHNRNSLDKTRTHKEYHIENGNNIKQINTENNVSYRLGMQKVAEGIRAAYIDGFAEYVIRVVKSIQSGHGYFPETGFAGSEIVNRPLDVNICIVGTRYLNELFLFREQKYQIIRIVRLGTILKGAAGEHASESEQDLVNDNYFDYVINNNSTLDDFNAKIKEYCTLYLG